MVIFAQMLNLFRRENIPCLNRRKRKGIEGEFGRQKEKVLRIEPNIKKKKL